MPSRPRVGNRGGRRVEPASSRLHDRSVCDSCLRWVCHPGRGNVPGGGRPRGRNGVLGRPRLACRHRVRARAGARVAASGRLSGRRVSGSRLGGQGLLSDAGSALGTRCKSGAVAYRQRPACGRLQGFRGWAVPRQRDLEHPIVTGGIRAVVPPCGGQHRDGHGRPSERAGPGALWAKPLLYVTRHLPRVQHLQRLDCARARRCGLSCYAGWGHHSRRPLATGAAVRGASTAQASSAGSQRTRSPNAQRATWSESFSDLEQKLAAQDRVYSGSSACLDFEWIVPWT
jgi:hypothetical protein